MKESSVAEVYLHEVKVESWLKTLICILEKFSGDTNVQVDIQSCSEIVSLLGHFMVGQIGGWNRLDLEPNFHFVLQLKFYWVLFLKYYDCQYINLIQRMLSILCIIVRCYSSFDNHPIQNLLSLQLCFLHDCKYCPLLFFIFLLDTLKVASNISMQYLMCYSFCFASIKSFSMTMGMLHYFISYFFKDSMKQHLIYLYSCMYFLFRNYQILK